MNASANAALKVLNTPAEINAIAAGEGEAKFERLPWQVLTPEAFEASQAHIQANFGRPPMAMAILAGRSKVLGHSLTEAEYRELVQVDELPEEHQDCKYPGCSHKVSPFRTALVLDGEIKTDRDGETTWRGNFLVVKLAEVGLTVMGFCNGDLQKARNSAQEACGEKLHPMPLSVAIARRQGIIDAAKRRQAATETFEARLAGPRSTAVKGQFGSAPRVAGDYVGRSRR